MKYRVLGATALFLTLAGPAAGVDGVIEINQACAAQRGPSAGDDPGCLPGDTDGFPVTIDATQSVRLTGNLTVPDENTTAISVSAPYVSVDLNGFAILGPATCSGAPLVCSPTGSGIGLEASSTGLTSVRNGTIAGMGQQALFILVSGQVSGLRLYHNGLRGMTAGPASVVSDNVVYRNGGDVGIFAGDGSILRGNTVFENALDGIASVGSSVIANAVTNNGARGLAGTRLTVVHNVFRLNQLEGISADWSTVLGNTLVDNTNVGLQTFLSTGYGNNTITGNAGGNANPQVDGGGEIEVSTNVCGDDSTCP